MNVSTTTQEILDSMTVLKECCKQPALALDLMQALKEQYIEALPYYRRRVVCTECGAEYERRETDNEYIVDLVKVCSCKADGKIMDAERSN